MRSAESLPWASITRAAAASTTSRAVSNSAGGTGLRRSGFDSTSRAGDVSVGRVGRRRLGGGCDDGSALTDRLMWQRPCGGLSQTSEKDGETRWRAFWIGRGPDGGVGREGEVAGRVSDPL